MAACFINLAGLLKDRRDCSKVEPLVRPALAIDENSLGPNYLVVANSLNNLATLLDAEVDDSGNERLFRRALANDERCWGRFIGSHCLLPWWAKSQNVFSPNL